MDYTDFARDLRRLADLFEAHADDLPLPKFAGQSVDFDIHTAEALDVLAAASALGSSVKVHDEHTTTTVDLGSVRLRFVHVSDEAMSRYNRRQSLLKGMAS